MKIAALLEKSGVSVFSDRAQAPSESWPESASEEIERASVVVAVWSHHALESPGVRWELEQVIAAWAEDRLMLVKLDDAELPLGLRDIEYLDLSGPKFRPGLGPLSDQVAVRVGKSKSAPPAKSWSTRIRPDPGFRKPTPKSSVSWKLAGAVLGVVAAVTALDVFLLEGSKSGPLEFLAVVDVSSLLIFLVIGAVAFILWIGFRKISSIAKNRQTTESQESERTPSGRIKPEDCQVFISYSRKDTERVEGIVARIEQTGLTTWMDTRSKTAQGRFAGPIVEAIKAAEAVAMMCSENSFSSDHVIRELYVAGTRRKPFVAILLDSSEFPNDFEYFLSGFPHLDGAEIQQDGEEFRRALPG